MPEEHRFEPLDAEAIAVGMYVRGTGRRDLHWTPTQVEGEVAQISGNRITLDGDAGGVREVDARNWEQRLPATQSAPSDGTWVSTPSGDLRVGDRARGKYLGNNETWAEGVIRVIEDDGVRFEGNRYLYTLDREWQRWTPAPDGAWVSAEVTDFEVGDRVRVTHRRTGAVHVGTVADVAGGGWIDVDHGEPRSEAFNSEYRTFEKWVPTPAPAGEGHPIALAQPQVGDRFTRVFNYPGIADRAGCVVRTVREVGDAPGQTLWSITYDDANGRYWDGELLVRPDGTCNPDVPPAGETRDTTGRYVPEVSATPTPAPVFAAPFVGEVFTRTQNVTWEDDRPNCTVTHVTRLTTPGEGWRVTYRARGVSAGEIYVLPDGTLTNTSGARPGRYVRTTPTPHNPFAPTSIPVAPAPESGAGAERALPEWATSLDAAKRHVHAQARRLYRRGDNCYAGSNDFANGLDLPDIGADYPVPVAVDESAQIRAFLTQVREVALGVARDHGKSISLVEGWLTEQGIPPVEVRHTVTFTAPAGHNVAQAFRDLGWLVQGNPFD